MSEKLSNGYLENICADADEDGGCLQDIAAELLALRTDAETSQNHNAGVIDRIVDQLREAGYTGTLSEMVDQACNIKAGA